MKQKTILHLAAVLLLFSLLTAVVGCGAGSPVAPETSPVAPETSAAATDAESAAASETPSEAATAAPVTTAPATTAAPEPEPQPQPETLKVVSFNIFYWDQQGSAKNNSSITFDATIDTRAPKLESLLAGEGIDILGVQEATSAWKAKLRGFSDFDMVGDKTSSSGEGGYILFRKEKLEQIADSYGKITLPALGKDESGNEVQPSEYPTHDRILTWVVLHLKNTDQYILVLDTHLHHLQNATNDDLVREAQAKAILAKIEELKTRYSSYSRLSVALTGDFNSSPAQRGYIAISGALSDSRKASVGSTVADEFATSPGFWYAGRSENNVCKNGWIIDYVFVSRNVTVKNYAMLHTATNLCAYGEYISDHNCVIAEIIPA